MAWTGIGRDAGAEARLRAPSASGLAARLRSPAALLSDALIGFTASVVLIGNIVAFSALMFPGAISDGVPVALWAMLLGSGLGGVWIALRTSMPPVATGIDTPSGAVLVVLSGSIGGAVMAGGGSVATAVQAAMLSFVLVAIVGGVGLLLLGWMRLGYLFRFVPYSVVGGFLAATGWFLTIGGLQVIAGDPLAFSRPLTVLTWENAFKLALAILTLVALVNARAVVKSPFAAPLVLIGLWIGGVIALRALGLHDASRGWYIGSQLAMESWSPLHAAQDPATPWRIIVHSLPEVFAAAIVTVLSLVTKITSIEATRSTAADLDHEFRTYGLASLFVAPFGGVAGSVQVGSSKLLKEAGDDSTLSGAIAALVLLAVLLTGVNIVDLIPMPIVVGLSFFLAYGFIGDALRRPLKMRAWFDIALIVVIALACARFGYMVGVAAGFLSACLLFALNYARVDVVKRRLSRTTFSSNVDRPRQDARLLRENGEAIQIYWLSGFIFFGSSDRVFERIRGDVEAKPRNAKFILLDFSAVTGADSSAVMSLIKLKNFADRVGVRIAYSGLTPAGVLLLTKEGLTGASSPHRMFATCDIALEWCEQNVLADAGKETPDEEMFDEWLVQQINPPTHAERLISYFERIEIPEGRVLYNQGEAADTMDFVASGSLLIELVGAGGERQRLRRIATHSIVGEMGFFRRLTRSATVTSDGPAVIYSLSRENFERMRLESPELSSALCEFVIQALSDRVDFANRAIAALAR